LNELNSKLLNKKQRYVYSTKDILPLLKLNTNTLVTLANNHIKDYGKKAFKNTLSVLSNNNIAYIGAGFNLHECQDYGFNDIVIININWVGVSKFGIPLHLYSATKNSFGANYIAYEKLLQKIKNYKKKNKKVVLIIHGGKELAKNEAQLGLDFEKVRLLNSDVTIIHHPHVYVQNKYEKNNIYVLGDFIFKSVNNRLGNRRGSALLKVTLYNDKLVSELETFRANEVYG
jgi:poly-gamma-glutamate synthesis protein (capsule biosynthesis protein)